MVVVVGMDIFGQFSRGPLGCADLGRWYYKWS